MHKLFDSHELPDVKDYRLKTIDAFRAFLFIFLGILSGGLLWLLSFWIPPIFYLLYRNETNIYKADYILYRKKSGMIIIERIKRKKCKINPLNEERYYLFTSFEGQLFYFSANREMFKSVQNSFARYIVDNPESKDQLFKGLSGKDAGSLVQFYGKNKLKLQDKSIFRLFMEEFFSPVLFCQTVVATAFALLGRGFYAATVVMFVIITIWIRLREYIRNRSNLHRISEVKDVIRVTRRCNDEDYDEVIDVQALTVGDVVHIDVNKKFACDMLVIQGSCLVNESMLTGEAVPIIKTNYSFDRNNFKTSNILSSGTFSVHNKTPIVKALVIGTGWNTSKGKLLGGIVFRDRVRYRFERDFFTFLACLFVFDLALAALVIFLELRHEDYQYNKIVMRVLEYLKNGFPPSVFFISIANIQQSSHKLYLKKISSLVSDKIIEGGALKTICFDKTGTLTETGLTLHGYLLGSESGFEDFGNNLDSVVVNPRFQPFIECLACCHSLVTIDGNIVGDPLDEQMYLFSRARLTERSNPNNPNQPFTSLQFQSGLLKTFKQTRDKYYNITKVFEFDSNRKRISVLVNNENDGSYRLFCKGAAEVVKTLCLPETVSQSFDELLNDYSQNGFRVIALAYKDIHPNDVNKSEDDLESNLNFLGFLVFDNPLKASTRPIIKELKASKHHLAMITGDNLYTGISVGYKAGLLNTIQGLYIGTATENKRLKWEYFDTSLLNKDHNDDNRESRHGSVISTHSGIKLNLDEINNMLVDCEHRNIKLALSGNAFDILMNILIHEPEIKEKVLSLCTIYGRCAAIQKKRIIEELKEIAANDEAYVGFVGDGSNDAMALKAANVGLSIGNDESSFSASFCSSITDISPIKDIIIEGKVCLSNALQQFKYLMTSVLFMNCIYFTLYYNKLDFVQAEFILMSLYFFPIAYLIGLTKAVPQLSPIRVKPSIMTKEYLTEFFGLGFLMIIFVFVNMTIYTKLQVYKFTNDIVKDYRDPQYTFEVHYFVTPKFILFSVLLFLCVSGLANHKSVPFRQPIYTNMPFIFYMTFAIFVAFFGLYFEEMNVFGDRASAFYLKYFRYPNFGNDNRSVIVGVMLVECLVLYLFNKTLEEHFTHGLYKNNRLDTVKTKRVSEMSIETDK